ncbi:DNA helicase [Tanacetum coccineum]
MASSGIASLLLPGGRTAHSRFKLPLELTDESLCHAKKSQLGNLLVEADLSIWDEAPMNDRWCFETLDRTLRDLMDAPSLLFGVKTVVLGGDFRQTLPVKKGADKNELIAASITKSHLWWHFKITISSDYLVDGDEIGLSKLIDFIYDDTTLRAPTAGSLQEKAIVCPKNATADAVNAKILSNIEGESRTYLSNDQATPIGRGTSKTELLYPMEYLNTITFPSFPPHELELKGKRDERHVNSGGICGRKVWLGLTGKALKIGQENCILEAKVYRKWISKSVPEMKELAFCYILMDRENNAIQVNMDINNIDYFDPLLKPRVAYRFSDFICEKTKPKESEFPDHHFEFIAYNQLPLRVPYRDENLKMVYPILTDYLGRVRSINDVLPSGDASMAQKYRRKVDTKNVEGKIIEFTMWDDMAKQFSKEEIQKLPPQSSLLSALAELTNTEVCLTIKDAKLLLRNKIVIPQCAMTNIQLAATPATHYYINPWAPEAEYIYTVFKQKCNLNPPFQVSKYQFKDLKARKNDEHTDFGHAATANPHKLQGTPSSTSAPTKESMENRKEASEAKGAGEFIADDVLNIEPAVQIVGTPSSTSVPAPESMEERQETTKGKEKTSAEAGTPPTSYSTVAEHPKKQKELTQHK